VWWNGLHLVAKTCSEVCTGGEVREIVEAMKGRQYLKKVDKAEAIGEWQVDRVAIGRGDVQ